ncbi:hypothetical protein KKB43_03340 [Patescibacteria group bacterium]|nr:hypothetical protein [Patescibacteria group bacterium]MBU4141400.1 hypothetical protein [Patescibacteria group bacterium]MBU4338465.1 hypothetical protein [Patescibacteria group bacterium]MBU4580027.1 hypothetical protein [Patescibacteria group bacterium]
MENEGLATIAVAIIVVIIAVVIYYLKIRGRNKPIRRSSAYDEGWD